MLSLRQPTMETIRRFLAEQGELDVTFSMPGEGGARPPAGYVVDNARIKLGEGPAVFAAAKAALERWHQCRLGWVEALPADTPLQVGGLVAVVAHRAGVWWLNACRIVAVIDEETEGTSGRFGFAYVTLPDHVARGEERFIVEWNRAGDGVWYDLRALSRPRHLLAWLGYPILRMLQKRFRRDSGTAMLKAVRGAS